MSIYIQCTCIYEYDVPQTIIYSTKFWYFLQIGTFNHCRNNYWLNSFNFFFKANLALSSCKLSTFYMCYNTHILLFPGLWAVQISSLSFRCNICPQFLSHRILGGGGGLFYSCSPVQSVEASDIWWACFTVHTAKFAHVLLDVIFGLGFDIFIDLQVLNMSTVFQFFGHYMVC